MEQTRMENLIGKDLDLIGAEKDLGTNRDLFDIEQLGI